MLGQFCVSIPLPLLTMFRKNEQNLRQTMLCVGNIVHGEKENFKITF